MYIHMQTITVCSITSCNSYISVFRQPHYAALRSVHIYPATELRTELRKWFESEMRNPLSRSMDFHNLCNQRVTLSETQIVIVVTIWLCGCVIVSGFPTKCYKSHTCTAPAGRERERVHGWSWKSMERDNRFYNFNSNILVLDVFLVFLLVLLFGRVHVLPFILLGFLFELVLLQSTYFLGHFFFSHALILRWVVHSNILDLDVFLVFLLVLFFGFVHVLLFIFLGFLLVLVLL